MLCKKCSDKEVCDDVRHILPDSTYLDVSVLSNSLSLSFIYSLWFHSFFCLSSKAVSAASSTLALRPTSAFPRNGRVEVDMTMSKLNRLRGAFSLCTRSSAMIIIRLKPSAKDARLLKRFIREERHVQLGFSDFHRTRCMLSFN